MVWIVAEQVALKVGREWFDRLDFPDYSVDFVTAFEIGYEKIEQSGWTDQPEWTECPEFFGYSLDYSEEPGWFEWIECSGWFECSGWPVWMRGNFGWVG